MARGTGNPFYKQVFNDLQQQILTGAIPEDSYLPSERELGIRFSVDRVTIRKALTMLVDCGLVEKRAGIGSYVKPASTYPTPLNESKNILFVAPRPDPSTKKIDSVFLANVLFNVERECRHQGYNLIYCRDVADSTILKLANGNAFKGIIFVSAVNPRLYQESLVQRVPSVLVNHYYEGLTCVLPDNEGGVFQAVQHLQAAGHEKIATITGARGYFNAESRIAAFRKAMTTLRLPLVEDYIVEGDWTYETGNLAMRQLLGLAEPPTAVVAANDATAAGAMHCIHELGYFVPGDISMVGFDNIERSANTFPRLTTVDVELASIVRISCMHLFGAMDNAAAVNCRIIVPVRLVERDSVGPVKKG